MLSLGVVLTPDFELEHLSKGFQVVGIDEVGRGSWAGPLVMAGYSLILAPENLAAYKPIKGVADSKQLNRIVRKRISTKAHREMSLNMARIEIVVKPANEISRVGLAACLHAGMRELVGKFAAAKTIFLVDGYYQNPREDMEFRSQPKADGTFYSVAVAANVAKVWRDNYMAKIHKLYPQYGFARHVGYGTRAHRSVLFALGPSAEHRLNYKPVQFATEQLRLAGEFANLQ